MTTTTMHFGPEWMRTKGSTRPAPEPPLPAATPAGTSTYSALVTPTTNPPPDRRDVSNPFRYAKEEMLRIYKEGGGRGGLGLEVERWDGIVREVGAEPVGLKEMSESEKKLFAGSLNSEIRRRQSTDVLSPLATSLGERPKLGHVATAAGSPMRERMSNLMGRRRDSTDQQPLGLGLPRKLSLSSMQSGTLASPRDAALPSPRTRIGGAPGFEGVLGESWSSRRRGDSLSKPSAESGPRRDREPTDPGKDLKDPDIKEEDEDMARKAEQGGSVEPDSRVAQPEALATNGIDKGATVEAVNNVNNGVAGLNLGSRERETNPDGPGTGTEQPGAAPVSKPPGLTDVSSVEWSYLDPQGNIQGPFRADIMQRWHNEGYFNPDLLMKRTHLDTEWTSVGEMVRRAGANPIFLTPGVTTSAPPGLSRRPDVLVDGPNIDRNSPLQPVPTVSRRGSTLESYLHNGSSASASPSSSFGGSRYQNGSPDPSSFDGRPGSNLFGEPTVGPRLATLASMPSIPNQRRSTFNDPFDSSAGLRSSFSHASLGRGLDNHGLNGINGFGSGTTPQLGQYTPGFDGSNADLGTTGLGMFGNNPGLAALRGAQDMPMGNANPGSMPDLGHPTTTSRIAHRDMYGKPAEDARPSPFGIAPLSSDVPYSPSVQSTSQAQSVPYSTSQDNRSLHSLTHTPLLERPPIAPMSSFSVNHQLQGTFVSSPVRAAAAPQWPPQPSPISRRPGPFDPDYPTANNTIITGMSTVSPMPYGRSMQTIPSNDQSPWTTTAQQGRPMNGWSKDTSSLTVENLGQHNQQQQEIPSQPSLVSADVAPHAEVPAIAPQMAHNIEANAPVAPPGPLEPTRSSQKTRRKSTAAQAVASSPTAPKAVVTPPAPIKPPSPAPAAIVSATTLVSDPKAPWATDDEAKKAKPSGATLGLREIQEAEMKKLEARKAAERERERAARPAAGTSQAEDFQPFTTSWGLPTSQAGAARSAAAPKDTVTSPVSSVTTPATTPVWTNTAKTPGAKKTMKEIQEEEERRKKLAAKEKETVAAAAKRANTTTKPASPAVQTTGGAWTTVGSGGKTAAATTPTAVWPAATATASARVVPTTSSPAVAIASAAVRAAPAVPSPRPTVTTKSSSKTDDFPTPPSQDFMKWMGESLKGLNSSVNFEEITSMLLSFPLDPDPSTVEIISDLIYASSTTLDGRRFAAEFVSRRKADAATRAKSGAPTGSSTKGVSIADVVKAQPKPAQQSEWGGFKVVNKKKKGGRA